MGAFVLLPLGAAGEEALSGVHFEAAARFGVAFQTYVAGDFVPELNVTAFPIWLDAGVRIGPLVFVGAYFSFAPASATPGVLASRAGQCDVNCYARVYRFGVEVQLHPVGVSLGGGVTLDPWVGIGTGYEVQQQRYTYDCDGPCPVPTYFGALQGPEYFNAQMGLALVFGRMSLGPYFAASYGTYLTDAGRAIFGGEPHWWLNVGLRFTVTP
jgi:hypothetical protein